MEFGVFAILTVGTTTRPASLLAVYPTADEAAAHKDGEGRTLAVMPIHRVEVAATVFVIEDDATAAAPDWKTDLVENVRVGLTDPNNLEGEDLGLNARMARFEVHVDRAPFEVVQYVSPQTWAPPRGV